MVPGEQQEAGLGGGGDGGSHLDLEPPPLLPPAPGLGLLQTRSVINVISACS